MADEGGASFKTETLAKIFAKEWSGKTKANQDALKLSAELMRCFVLEAAHRAGVECKASGLPEVTPEHLEKVLPQLLLDF
eukprot:gene4159-19166_t